MENDLVGLAGLHPGDIPPLDAGMNIWLQVAAGYPPAIGQRENQEVARSEKKVIGGDDMLGQVKGHVPGRASGASQLFLQQDIQLIFVLSRVFLLPSDDEGWVSVDPVSDGFIYALKRLNVDDFYQNLLTVFPGQLPDPIG
jgi:hypothetical protein